MTKTHIVEQREDGICFPVERVYLVRQTQPSADYHQQTIYVLTDEDEAKERARELNKEYGEGCKFSEDYDFEEVDWDNYCYDDVHYYDVEEMLINKPMAK